MKKIISHYYFIIAVLLVIADQFLIRLVLHSDLAAGLSDFAFLSTTFPPLTSCNSASVNSIVSANCKFNIIYTPSIILFVNHFCDLGFASNTLQE